MTDSKYFTTNKKGEIFELKAELNNEKKEKRKEAVKKVIAAMTVGKDVSSLFPDVVNCMQTDNLELKKLVYLYLMNYAKSQPDMAIMAVNSFVKDCEDPNPLIRALAVRTMGCIRVDKITEYLCEPLRKCLKDEDPYVRKTAAVCVAKLHDINAQMVEDQGFLDSLRDLIADSNPMVVANAVAALSEISESHPNSNLLDLNPQNINKLLTALNECTEWGQIFILDCLSNYNPKDEREAQSICERVTPRLSHANSAVVLSAVKVLMKFLELLPKDSDYYNTLLKKLSPPLVTLLSGEPEVQYVALRNINLIVQKRPEILKQEIKVFFVKYNDPIYVKLEKLDIMIRLASQANIAQVLAELKEYATEVDVDFVRKAVRAIGRCAIKVEQSAERCVSTLLDLIQTKVNYVVQEAIVVIRDIFRKYPNKYESIIATLCENLDSLDEPDARAAMIWIVGEYAERIDNADELLESFLEGFHDESTQVQLTLLTAIVKLFLKKPSETQELVQQVLSLATQDSDNPDLRDRGYIYWRLLSTDPVTAKEVVLSEKPLISEETDLIEPTLLDELICHIGSLASVYHKPPSAFVEGSHGIHRKHLPVQHSSIDTGESPVSGGPAAAMDQPHVIPSQGDLLGDLLNLDLGPPVNVPQVSSMQMGAVDLLGGGLDSLVSLIWSHKHTHTHTHTHINFASSECLLSVELITLLIILLIILLLNQVWLPAVKAKGLEISGTFSRRQGHMYMDMTFTNKALQHMTDFAIQFNKNSFGVIPTSPLPIHTPLMPSQSIEISLPLNTIGPVMKMDPLNNLQVQKDSLSTNKYI
uniref:AP complex subunit beta n=1 Tax=Lates calcarifer TaxID=8187 RepID=A0A4W6DCR9_LATCA